MKTEIHSYMKENRENMVDKDSKYYEFLDMNYEYGAVTEFPVSESSGMDRYLPLLPIHEFQVSTEGLGDTPLQQAEQLGQALGLSDLWIKREDLNPTGCFKDRESSVIVSAAVEAGHKKVYIVSSGNAALSTAKYATEVGIECVCYVPDKTSQDKKDLIVQYGATLKTIPGFYEDVYRAVVDMSPEGWNVTSGQNPYRIEGGKTMAYEMVEQLGKVPEVILIPSGNGGCLAATWKGFVEMHKLGMIQSLPQMVCVQVEGAAPIKIALEQNKPFVTLGDIEDSIAEGIVAQESYNSPQAVQALIESNGYVLTVSDEEIKEALKLVIEAEGIYPEPTSAAVYAALGKLDPASVNKTIVAVNTGDGKKMLEEIEQVLQG